MRIVPYVLATFMVFSAVSVSAQTIGTSTIDAAKKYKGAPGPILGAGLPLLGAGGIGYGVYWLVKRRRRKTEV